MNKIMIMGRVGKVPELKTFDWGKVANFTIATDESYKNKEGQKVDQVEWHNVTARLAMADFAVKFLKKGKRVLVEGSLRMRQYDQNGETKKIYEIIATHITPIDWPDKKEPENDPAPFNEPVDDLPF